MNYREKKPLYDKLKGEQHFDADLALLKEKAPKNPWCAKKIFHKAKAQAEILWILLDLVSGEEIITNRKKLDDSAIEAEVQAKIDQCTALVGKLAAAETYEEASALLIQLKELRAELPEEVQAEMEEIDESILEKLKPISDKEPLPAADDTEKTSEGTGEKMEGTTAAADGSENVLEVTEGESASESSSEENEDLKNENENLKEEKEELEYEKEELEEKVEQLEEELEAEKKNQPEPLKKASASKSTKSTRTSTGKTSKGKKTS